jgi:mRNA interferase HigB
MKVHLIKRQTILDYTLSNASARIPFKLWLAVLSGADWSKPEDIKETFGAADILGKNCDRVVFDIGGNNYRIICHFVFGQKQVHLFVCWIGTHAAYNKLCNDNKQYLINLY